MAKWETVGWTDDGSAGVLHIPDGMHFEPLDTETTVLRSWGGETTFTWTSSRTDTVDDMVQAIIDEKTGGHMAKKVSAHADPKFTDGVWICSVCESESMDKQMFEEAGEWEECAKNHARVATGEEKDALGRYVAGAEAKQNLDRATKAIKDFREGMKQLGLAAADMNMVMQAMTGNFDGIVPEDINRLTKKFPELKPALSEVKFPKEVTEELKPLNQREWHKELMSTLDHYYTWNYMGHYSMADRVLDAAEDAWDYLLYNILRIR